MKRKIAIACATAFLLLGVACLSYPVVSNAIIHVAQGQVAKEHVEAERAVDTTELEAMRRQAYGYNENLLAGKVTVTDPFDPDRITVGEAEYDSTLNVTGDGVMAVIRAPKIDITLPIYHGVGDKVLEHGVGHLPSTSLPIGGASSHCVLAGHTGLPSVKIFDEIGRLEEGDYFAIEVLGEEHGYRVDAVEVVLPEDTDSLAIVPGADKVTLATCTPYGVNSHRLLVHASRCELPDGWDQGGSPALEGTAEGVSPWPTVAILFTVAVLVAVTALLLRRRARNARDVRCPRR
ncbi:class C sortase [Curtanaerobium respiraculi]|uniref:class C sortase n=1 Tax=Curtanaerobium respiraculi TaxID=2949669 RepID=UPI0024B34B59|nr:class C sortase [Curtanaerobium respiraculi]